MLEHAWYDSFIETHTNTFLQKIWHLFKRSLKFLNLATFRLKSTGRKDDFKIVAIVAKHKGVVRNYQGGRVANNRGRVMIFCVLKKGGLQFFSCHFGEGHDFSCHNLVEKFFILSSGSKIPCLFFYIIHCI